MGKLLRQELSFKTIKFEDKMDNCCIFYELKKKGKKWSNQGVNKKQYWTIAAPFMNLKKRKRLVKLGDKLKIILDDCCTFCELESEPEP